MLTFSYRMCLGPRRCLVSPKGHGYSLIGETAQKARCVLETINHDRQVAGAIWARYPHVFLLFPDSNHACGGVCLLKTKIFKHVKNKVRKDSWTGDQAGGYACLNNTVEETIFARDWVWPAAQLSGINEKGKNQEQTHKGLC